MLRPLFLFVAFALVASGCKGIDQSSRSSPRAEAEVRVVIGPSLEAALSEEGTSRTVESTVQATVLAVADMGLRLYPIPTEAYKKSDAPAPYELIVKIEDFQTRLGQRTEPVDANSTRSLDQIEEIGVEVSATLRKRRPAGPALVLGMSRASGRLGTESDPMVVPLAASFSSRTIMNADRPERIPADDLAKVVDRAVTEALSRLVEPLHRELMRSRKEAEPTE